MSSNHGTSTSGHGSPLPDLSTDGEKLRSRLLEGAKAGDPHAQFELSALLCTDGDLAGAAEWLLKASDRGYGPAQYAVAADDNFELDDVDRAKLLDKALAWHEERAQSGDAHRQHEYARLLLSGSARPVDRADGLQWLTTAANQGHNQACVQLGRELLRSGDTERGIAYLLCAADAGDKDACKSLADLYAYGHAEGLVGESRKPAPRDLVTPDPKSAIEWYTKAIELGNRYTVYILGKMLLDGRHLPQDIKLAEAWLLRGAEDGMPSAQLLLGKEYLRGDRLEANVPAAIRWLRAASASSGEATVLLGDLHRSGELAPNSAAEAACWYSLALLGDSTTWPLAAMNALGEMCASGEFGARDEQLAQRWWRKIAERCHAELRENHLNPSHYEFILAELHESGRGVEKDLKRAVELYRQAASHDHRGAIARLKQIEIEG